MTQSTYRPNNVDLLFEALKYVPQNPDDFPEGSVYKSIAILFDVVKGELKDNSLYSQKCADASIPAAIFLYTGKLISAKFDEESKRWVGGDFIEWSKDFARRFSPILYPNADVEEVVDIIHFYNLSDKLYDLPDDKVSKIMEVLESRGLDFSCWMFEYYVGKAATMHSKYSETALKDVYRRFGALIQILSNIYINNSKNPTFHI